jgi:hypothetical protein
MGNDAFHKTSKYVRPKDSHSARKIWQSLQLSHANIRNLFGNRYARLTFLKADAETCILCPCKNKKLPRNTTKYVNLEINTFSRTYSLDNSSSKLATDIKSYMVSGAIYIIFPIFKLYIHSD